MKTVFEGDVFDVLPTENGMLIAYCSSVHDDKMEIEYKLVNFSDGKMTTAATHIYPLTKFGTGYKAFRSEVENLYTCHTIFLPSGKLFVYETNGDVKILDTDASVLWQGSMTYKGEAPAKVTLYDNKFWACYEKSGVIIKYNNSNLREELRIGGGENSPFEAPKDICIIDSYAYIANSLSKQILKMSITSYDISVYGEYTETVKNYLNINGYEFVVLTSGIYMID